MKSWRYLPYAVFTGAENMAIDEAILLSLNTGLTRPKSPASTGGGRQRAVKSSMDSTNIQWGLNPPLNEVSFNKEHPLPTLRFYGWNPATLSLGYAQSYAKEVEVEACRAAGLDVVRRPTGGRAVLHQYELTYSVIAPETEENVAGTVIESYLKISQALLAGFQALGIPAEMAAHANMKEQSSAACFDAPSWYELVVDGRKLVGSAQVRKDGILLQHGSIILRFDADLLFRVLKFPSEEARRRLLQSFRRKACALDEVWPRPVSVEALETSICRGFEQVMGLKLVEGTLSQEEESLLPELTAKYRSEAWTQKR